MARNWAAESAPGGEGSRGIEKGTAPRARSVKARSWPTNSSTDRLTRLLDPLSRPPASLSLMAPSSRREVPGALPACQAGCVLWAHLVAVVHGLAVVLMLTGALVALRLPRLLWVHVPVAAAILTVNLAGAPCPLTDLELALRERAGGEPYTGGFLGHYALAPFGLEVASPAVQAGVHTDRKSVV